ncbi:MAG: DNA primase [Bacteroidetes bacterium]|nr:MAG: DNA primase [Bacteroidota bacterium]
MYIGEDKIEEIRAASDIVDIVSDYVRLKKRGSNYFGLCPFHQEKSPSFSVNPGMGIFKCFGCHAGGDVFTFVQRVENLTFVEAARLLAERAGITLPEDEGQLEEASETEAIYHALRFAGRFYYRQLTRTEAGAPALAYLRQRGFSAETIKHFGLGYAPPGWDALLTAAGAQHIAPETLEKAGLVIPRKDGSGYYDRFRDRVIFPIFSHVGKVLGFGGRILQTDADQPKYINSPETKVYAKSRVLYGLYQARQAIRQREEVILVEGYTDVLSLHQAGVEHVVASSGTALTVEQIKLIHRYARRVLLLYDADSAGATAALRGIDLVLAQGLAVYAVELPAGEDPDSFVQAQGAEGFEAYVEQHRRNFVRFMMDQARRAGELDTPEGTAAVRHRIIGTLARIPDPVFRDAYVQEAAEVLTMYETDLRAALDRQIREQRHRQAREEHRPASRATAPPEAPPPDDAGARASGAPGGRPAATEPEPLPEEKILLRLMLERGLPMVEFILGHMALDEFTPGPAQEMVRHLLAMYEAGQIQTRNFTSGAFGEAVQRLAAEVLMDPHEPSQHWGKRNISVPRLNEDPVESASSAMMLLKLDRVDAAIADVRRHLLAAQDDEAALRDLQRRMIDLQELRKQIQQRAFLDW